MHIDLGVALSHISEYTGSILMGVCLYQKPSR